MNTVQLAARRALRGRPSTHPQAFELPYRHDPVLPIRDSRYQ